MISKLFLCLVCLILIKYSQQRLFMEVEDETLTASHLLEKIESVRIRIDEVASKINKIQKPIQENTLDLFNLTRHNRDEDYPRNCKEVQKRGHNKTDLYFIKPLRAPEPFLVLCDMNTTGGGWTTIFRRYDGTVNFDLDWEDYKHGFGRLREEFWLGLEKIHLLTGTRLNELLIEVSDRLPGENSIKKDHYKIFSIGSENEGYIIKLLEDYEGDAGNAFCDSYGAKFSTKDNNQDPSPVDKKCAALSGGGWWHRGCASILLTAKWDVYHTTMSLQETRMLIRPSFTRL